MLWLCDFFQVNELLPKLCHLYIMPQLTVDNVLDFIEDACKKLSKSSEKMAIEETWFELLNFCLDYTAERAPFFTRKLLEKPLDALTPSVVEEFIERALKYNQTQILQGNITHLDLDEAMTLMLKVRKFRSVFRALHSEEEKIIENDSQLLYDEKPLLTWKLQKLGKNFFKESEPFTVDGLSWVLTLWSFSGNNLQLGCKVYQNTRG